MRREERRRACPRCGQRMYGELSEGGNALGNQRCGNRTGRKERKELVERGTDARRLMPVRSLECRIPTSGPRATEKELTALEFVTHVLKRIDLIT